MKSDLHVRADAKMESTIRRLYSLFNARDVDAVLAMLDPEVQWANGWEGGHVHGREAVRAYWARQWAALDPTVEPMSVADAGNGDVLVKVHQVVRDLNGALLADVMVGHQFHFVDGVVTRFDIREAEPSQQASAAE